MGSRNAGQEYGAGLPVFGPCLKEVGFGDLQVRIGFQGALQHISLGDHDFLTAEGKPCKSEQQKERDFILKHRISGFTGTKLGGPYKAYSNNRYPGFLSDFLQRRCRDPGGFSSFRKGDPGHGRRQEGCGSPCRKNSKGGLGVLFNNWSRPVLPCPGRSGRRISYSPAPTGPRWPR